MAASVLAMCHGWSLAPQRVDRLQWLVFNQPALCVCFLISYYWRPMIFFKSPLFFFLFYMVHQKQEVKRYEYSACELAERPFLSVLMNLPPGATKWTFRRGESCKWDPRVVSWQEWGRGGGGRTAWLLILGAEPERYWVEKQSDAVSWSGRGRVKGRAR